MARQLPRTVPAVLTVGVLALSALTGTVAQAAGRHHASDLRLFTPDRHVVLTVHNSGKDEWIDFNPSMYLESKLHRFEVDVRRKNASRPITATVRIGSRTRKLRPSLLDGWNGLKKAFTLTWTTPSGTQIARTTSPWCPNDGTESRLGPHAETTTDFIYGCTNNPFTRGERWGIDRGWSRQVLQYEVVPPTKDLGKHAVLAVTLRPALARAFGIPADQSTLHFDVTVKHVTDDDGGPFPGPPSGTTSPASAAGIDSASSDEHRSAPASASAGTLPRGILPDLVALPAWQIGTHHEDGRDLLDFAATVYNGGPGPLVAEGFRRGSKPVMNAYQFFYRGTTQVAERRVGTMEYDARPTHQHWHFRDFAVYDLVNRGHHRLRTSGKEAFCLAPTDAINLLQPGAVVDPGNPDLSTACGDITSIWVREVLDSGWGDTYSQQRAGQSIDITGRANGTYWIRVTANPVHRLHELTRKNNVSLRRVILGGTPGHRTVKVPNYGRINSEAGFEGEGGGGVVTPAVD
ncbi:MAG: putative secreted protein [Marmoricola sp.]|nr:putative secreted protein [Marmoricola sp.]